MEFILLFSTGVAVTYGLMCLADKYVPIICGFLADRM